MPAQTHDDTPERQAGTAHGPSTRRVDSNDRPPAPPNLRRRRRIRGLAVAVLALGGVLALLIPNVWTFLTVPTDRREAQVLVLEGWAVEFEFCVATAAQEFGSGDYAFLATSGIEDATPGPDGARDSAAARAARRLVELGIDPARIVTCPAPATRKNKTSSSARAVREHLRARGITCSAINVVTTEPHSRQSRLAYRRMFEPEVQVGMIPVPNPNLTAGNWWKTTHGWRVAAKTFAGWAREWLFGLRD